jgi:integrase
LRFRRPNGKPAKLTLGPVDFSGKEPEADPVIGAPLTLAAARALAADQHRQRKRGVDVAARHVADKRRAKQSAASAAGNSFAALARCFIDEYAKPNTRRWRDTAALFGLDYPKDGGEPTVSKGGLAERWSGRELRSIDGDDLHGIIVEARQSGIPGRTRHRKGISNPRGRAMAAAMSKFFAWAKDERHVSVNPTRDVHKPKAPKPRERVLNVKMDVRRADEVRWLWSAAAKLTEPFGALVRLLLLTGCRLNELSALRRDEVSDDLSTLSLPGARTKNRRAHDIYLPPLASNLLSAMNQPIKGCKFVFTTTGTTPVSGFSKMKRQLDSAILNLALNERGDDAAMAPWRLHDLRRTCATGMAGIGIAPHVVEACLNHISGAKASVAGVYNRETYEPEKRIAWQRWADHVDGIVSNSEIRV